MKRQSKLHTNSKWFRGA